MTYRKIITLGLATGLLLAGPLPAAGNDQGANPPPQQQWPELELRQTPAPAGEAPGRMTPREQWWPEQNRRPSSGSPGGMSEQAPPFDQQRRGMDRQPFQSPEHGTGSGFFQPRDREPLHAPPPSVQPRRNGPGEQRFRPEQPGPRRFAPTPDLNGGGSPFELDRRAPRGTPRPQRP